MAGIGDNSTSSELILHAVQECERLIEERKGINEQINDILSAAEGQGLDKKTLREMIRLRAMDKDDRLQRETLRDLYLSSLGLLD